MNRAEESKEALRTQGWTKGKLQDRYGRVCMLGAIATSYGLDLQREMIDWEEDSQLLEALREVILEQFPERTCKPLLLALTHVSPISYFNDDERTTLEDVELVFDKAAAKLDELI